VRSAASTATPVCADRERVVRVLTALLGEAIAAARVGAEIIVGHAPSPEGVRFTINEASPTLPGPLERLYEPAAVAPSSKLELLLCKRVIEAHGGRMGMEVAATGRTCWFTLPAEPSLLR
jgi:signal transduction histidine kinase